ncbi:MAG TPA: PQQ-binding-like beta-propeller repeat protein [Pseudomonadales bacterium]|nr:PQQ-binding-like beta-propeller repeat protein [Pseudomonadales bacterium]
MGLLTPLAGEHRSFRAGHDVASSNPYITAFNSSTGKTYWSVTLADVMGDFQQLVLLGSAVCAGGDATDDDGDGGTNVVVACFNASKGTLLWKKEFENPSDGSTNLQFQSVSGGKGLLVGLYDTDSSDTIVLAVDPKTGNIVQQD